MANIKKKSKPRTNARKVWTMEDSNKFGKNPFGALITTILEKEIEIGASVSAENNLMLDRHYQKEYYEHRPTIKFYFTAIDFLCVLNQDSMRLLWYLSTQMLDNLNLARIGSKEDVIKFCKYKSAAEVFLTKQRVKGKIIDDETSYVRDKVNRIYRDSFNDLRKRKFIVESNVKGYYWIDPRISIKGSAENIPLSYNNYNEKKLIVIKRGHHYKYGNVEIVKQGSSFLIMDDTGLLVKSVDDAIFYIDNPEYEKTDV